MPVLHIGSAGFSRPRSRYARKLSFVEVDLRPPLPAPKVVARWREELGDAFMFAVVAPQALWGDKEFPLRDAKALRSEIDRIQNVTGALKPRALVLRTPTSIRPGSAGFKRFLENLEQFKKLAPVIVWEPLGVWEHDEAIAAVRGTGLVVASDPLRDPVAGETIVYARMKGLGADRRYHEGRLEDLAVALGDSTEAFIVFDTPSGYNEATKLIAILEGAAAEGDDETRESKDRVIGAAGEEEADEDEEEDDADESDEDDEDYDEDEDDDADGDDADDEDEDSDEEEDDEDADDEDDGPEKGTA